MTKVLLADQSEAVATAPPRAPISGALQIAVLAGLAAMGTLATNIMLPSLPQMATSLNVASAAILLVSLFSPTFLPFLCAMSVFLLGMGIVTPLGTAQAHSPFGEKAGAASARLGFWQMMNAAAGVWLAAIVSHQAMFALGVVLTIFSLAALGLYALKPGVD